MIEIELRTPQADAASDVTSWRPLVRMRVAGGASEVTGEERILDFTMPVPNLRTRGSVRYEDDPEEWARNLGTVYHAPDLVVVVIEDDNPIPPEALPSEAERERVRLRERVTA
jgi:predicted pyridoxine 5'-phosphate oxidase superfamily flavin-nucleotide-binding protein